MDTEKLPTALQNALNEHGFKPTSHSAELLRRAAQAAGQKADGTNEVSCTGVFIAAVRYGEQYFRDPPPDELVTIVGMARRLLEVAERPLFDRFEAGYFTSGATSSLRQYGTYPHALPSNSLRIALERGRRDTISSVLDCRLLVRFVLGQSDAALQRRLQDIGVSSSDLIELLDRREKSEAPVESRVERVGSHFDAPATVDHLGRRPFADVIASRMDELHSANRRNGGQEPFMLNIHGPWGIGKTTVLNFLGANLQAPQREASQRWVVISFNAWRHQRIRPPWWSVIQEVYVQSLQQLGGFSALLLRVRWTWWRAQADWMPSLTAAVALILAVLIVTGVIDFLPSDTATPKKGWPELVEIAFKIGASVIAVGGAWMALSRSLVFGSSQAAETYVSMSRDTLAPILDLFGKLVAVSGRPVAIFVDDLDRCESKYVVELLEGIQTLFCKASVVYVVAADRKWICSSFETAYKDFVLTVGKPGHPLGYLFLDKIFQASAAVPLPLPHLRAVYWSELLIGGTQGDARTVEVRRKKAEEEASKRVASSNTLEQLELQISESRGDPEREAAMRVAAAKQITAPSAARASEHRLQPFAKFLEPNPRAMKRLVNLYGLQQATLLLEGRTVSADALAVWTIVGLRWPLVSELLTQQPTLVDRLRGESPDRSGVPGDLLSLLVDDEFRSVLRAGDARGEPFLTGSTIQQIVGTEVARPPSNQAA